MKLLTNKFLLWSIAVSTIVVFISYNILAWYRQQFHAKAALSIVINNPTTGYQLFDPTSLRILALGGLIFLFCWGVSKVLKAWR